MPKGIRSLTLRKVSNVEAAGSKQNGQHRNTKHRLTILKRAVNGVGNRLLDKRTVTGKALAKWRNDLIADLGGDVTTQQFAMIDLCVKSKLMLDSIDAWLLVHPSLVNARKTSLVPMVKERQALADGLRAISHSLGLGAWPRTAILWSNTSRAHTATVTAATRMLYTAM